MAVHIRLIEKEDTDNILRWRNNPEIRSNFVFQDELTREAHENWLDTNVKSGKAAQFIIVTDEFGDVGSAYLRDIDLRHRKAEFGIFIGEDAARGKGFGNAATLEIIKHAFRELDLNKVYLRVFTDNIAAIKNNERAGFAKEGCFAEDVIIDNKPRDLIFMGLLKSQYERINRDEKSGCR